MTHHIRTLAKIYEDEQRSKLKDVTFKNFPLLMTAEKLNCRDFIKRDARHKLVPINLGIICSRQYTNGRLCIAKSTGEYIDKNRIHVRIYYTNYFVISIFQHIPDGK